MDLSSSEYQRFLENYLNSYLQNDDSNSSSSSSSSSSSEEDNSTSILSQIPTIVQVIRQALPQLIQTCQSHTRDYVDRDWAMGHNRLFHDYFSDRPVYGERLFRRKYRMRKHLFLRIQKACEEHDIEFQQRCDATGRLGLSSLQKVSAALFMLVYGTSADKDDHYIRIGASTARVALLKFCEAVISKFGNEYLRHPTAADLHRLLQINENRGFPGMIGSVDCMHWIWKNCPVAWRHSFRGRSGKASIILQAVASQDLWIWHAFFGLPGSCSDMEVLHRSPLFDDLLNDRTPPVTFEVNGRQYDKTYYLTDGTYPQWSSFIQSINLPRNPKQILFTQRQEAVHKDVERAFRNLQARFAVVRNPSLAWDEDISSNIMMTCIILHNMIVEDERENYKAYADTRDSNDLAPEYGNLGYNTIQQEGPLQVSTERIVDIGVYMNNRERLRDKRKHLALKADLIEHVWHKFGNGGN